MTGTGGTGGVRARLRAALPAALKARDQAAVAALRSALGAIDNAEAPAAEAGPSAPAASHARVAGTVEGLGAAEVARLCLTEAQVVSIVGQEIADRLAAAADYERAGQAAPAERLRAEAGALSAVLDGPGGPVRG